jgi:hypothetical protein
MPTYNVKVDFSMGMSEGSGIHTFDSKNDKAARQYLRRHTGKELSLMRRNAQFDSSTLCRKVGR